MVKWKVISSSFLERVNQTAVTAELLGEVLKMHAELPAEDRPVFEVRAVRMFELLKTKGFGESDIATIAMAIDFRLQALAKLDKSVALRGWSMSGAESGQSYIHADLLKAAAEEPLIEDAKKQASFDAESFRRRVLTDAEVDGHA